MNKLEFILQENKPNLYTQSSPKLTSSTHFVIKLIEQFTYTCTSRVLKLCVQRTLVATIVEYQSDIIQVYAKNNLLYRDSQYRSLINLSPKISF